jgi:hypothetical protein
MQSKITPFSNSMLSANQEKGLWFYLTLETVYPYSSSILEFLLSGSSCYVSERKHFHSSLSGHITDSRRVSRIYFRGGGAEKIEKGRNKIGAGQNCLHPIKNLCPTGRIWYAPPLHLFGTLFALIFCIDANYAFFWHYLGSILCLFSIKNFKIMQKQHLLMVLFRTNLLSNISTKVLKKQHI